MKNKGGKFSFDRKGTQRHCSEISLVNTSSVTANLSRLLPDNGRTNFENGIFIQRMIIYLAFRKDMPSADEHSRKDILL